MVCKITLATVIFLLQTISAVSLAETDYTGKPYLEIVKRYADFVIREGRDQYGPIKTKMFVDGINIKTRRPVEWVLAKSKRSPGYPKKFIMLNFANQQNLLRTLVGLSELTGDPKYSNAAMGAVSDAFTYLSGKNGLFYWGGEALWSADTDQPIAYQHEFKAHYPFYDLLWQVNPKQTEALVQAIWGAHVRRWDILEFDRHAKWDTEVANTWDYIFDEDSEVPFVGQNVHTFMATGIDLVYAVAHIYKWTGQEKPLLWAKRLAKRYVDSRDPSTGLGPAEYTTTPRKRIEKQFRHFNDARPPGATRLTESTITDLYRHHRYTMGAAGQLWVAEALGQEGEPFLRWAVDDLSAYARYAYDSTDNSFWATLIDGTRLTPNDYESHKGYSYVQKNWLEKLPATTKHFWLYARAYRLSGERLMWEMARNIAIGSSKNAFNRKRMNTTDPGYATSFRAAANLLGDIGRAPYSERALNFETENSDYHTIFGLLELYRATEDVRFRNLAESVADNAIERHLVGQCFAYSQEHVNCDFDYSLPLALLHLEDAVEQVNANIPKYVGGWTYFHGFYRGKGRVYDRDIIFDKQTWTIGKGLRNLSNFIRNLIIDQ